MRLTGLRLSTRRTMAMVAVAALALWPAATAVRVSSDPQNQYLSHSWRGYAETPQGPITCKFTTHPAPYFPRYWRRLVGAPWPGSYVCHDALQSELPRGGWITV